MLSLSLFLLVFPSAILEAALVAISARILMSPPEVKSMSPLLVTMLEDLMLMLPAEMAVKLESRIRLLVRIVSLLVRVVKSWRELVAASW